MRATAWSNGHPSSSGGGYGLRIGKGDRDRYFAHAWDRVDVAFDDGNRTTVAISRSFWGNCSELRSAEIGRWLLRETLAPWPRGNPPSVVVEPLGERSFRVARQ